VTRACTAVLSLLLVCLASSARADAPLRVAVVVNNVVNITTDEAARISAAIASALRQELSVVATGDAAIQAAAASAAPDLETCVVEPTCISAVRQATEVDALLFVSMARIGTITRLEARYVAPGLDRSVQVLDTEMQDLDAQWFRVRAASLVPDAKKRSPANPDPTLAPAPEPSAEHTGHWAITTPAVVAGTATLLTAGAATWLGISALACQSDPCSPSEADSANTKALVTDVLWGATLAGAAVTGYFLWRGTSAETDVAVVPTSDGARLVVGGRF